VRKGAERLGAQAAVERDGDAGEEAGAVGGEEPRELGDVLGTTEAPDRDLRAVVVGVGREAEERGVSIGPGQMATARTP